MKKIFCPKCDNPIVLTAERLRQLRERGEERFSIVCPSCTHQLNLKLRLPKEEGKQRRPERESVGHLLVVENGFGYKQTFPLYLGTNRIGRRNKDTETDIPIITGDPSMDRHHAIIKVTQGKTGALRVSGQILGPRESIYLQSGDVITLGATSIIFSDQPLEEEADIS